METGKNRITGRQALVRFGFTLLFNSIIAVFLSVVLYEASFWLTFIISHSIGLTIFAVFTVSNYFFDIRGWRVVPLLLISAIAGVATAYVVTSLISGEFLPRQSEIFTSHIQNILFNLFMAVFFGSIILYFLISREKQHQASQELKEFQLKSSEHKKQIAETKLQLLQAQIEPHFLFNSLSNVVSLMEVDTARARLMLESLTHYLRASLSRSHDKNGTLQDELDLIENYLKVLQIRMGDRLRYQINVDEQLLSHSFPIMLLQPVVENAIKHGLEPKAEGGHIDIVLQQMDNRLRISVIDDGVGLKKDDLKGFGLMNVRKRLQSLYAEEAKLSIENNPPQGVCVTIEMPYE